MNQDGIDDRNKDAALVKLRGDCLMVSASGLHQYLRVAIQRQDTIRKAVKPTGVMANIFRRHHYLAHRTENRHRAPALGNINTDRFYSLPVQSPWRNSNAPNRWYNLRKSNAANERGG